MSSPRLRRLRLDHERLNARFCDWPAIRITGSTGDPPERYQIAYYIRGLYSTPTGQLLERSEHMLEVNLSLGYPRRAPQCKMLTPIFHPNFDEVSVCIGDFWAASEGLDDLIIRIGRMIAYQEYNTKSPLNGLAAKWAEQNAYLLPADNAELAPPSEQTVVENIEKLVVQLDDDLPPSEISVESGPSDEISDEIVSPAEVYTPRLDFGMIAVTLYLDKITIGRSPDNSIQLSDSSVSAFHAELIRTESGYILCDLDSTNGTILNDSPISQAQLINGSLIRFGKIEATFLD